MTFGYDCTQFLIALVVYVLNIGEYDERIFEAAAKVLHGVDVGIASERCSVSGCATLVARAVGTQRALAHCGLSDNQPGTTVVVLRLRQCLTYLVNIVAVDGKNVPIPCTIFHCGVLSTHFSTLC